MGTKALAEVTISVSWNDLPPDANCGWLRRFPSIPSEVIEAYLKNLEGYSKKLEDGMSTSSRRTHWDRQFSRWHGRRQLLQDES